MYYVRPPTALTLLLIGPLLAAANQPGSAAPRPADGPGFVFSPKVLNFGRVPWRDQGTQLLTLTLDKRRFDTDHLPVWTSGDFGGNVTITQFSRRQDHDHVILTYQVTLPDTMGPFYGWIRLVFPEPATLRDRPLENQGVLVTGEVVPGICVSPAVVDFGRVLQGKGGTALFSLCAPVDNLMPLRAEQHEPAVPVGYGLGSIRDIPIVSSSRYVSARLRFVMGSMDAVGWTYEATLDPATPAGSFQQQITFTTTVGQVIVVPIYAQVITAAENQK